MATGALLGHLKGVGRRAFIKNWSGVASKSPSGAILDGSSLRKLALIDWIDVDVLAKVPGRRHRPPGLYNRNAHMAMLEYSGLKISRRGHLGADVSAFRRRRFGVDLSAWTSWRGRFGANVSARTFRRAGFGTNFGAWESRIVLRGKHQLSCLGATTCPPWEQPIVLLGNTQLSSVGTTHCPAREKPIVLLGKDQASCVGTTNGPAWE